MNVKINNKIAHYVNGGRSPNANEPAIVLVHGAGMDRTAWQLQTREIAHKGFQVYAVDLPGHGRSTGPALQNISLMADWVAQFIQTLKIEPAIVIGHSMGALIATEAAARNPSIIKKLVLIGAAGSMPVHPDLLEAAKNGSPLAQQLIVAWGIGPTAQIGGHLQPGYWVLGASHSLLKLAKSGVLFTDLNACNNYRTGNKSAASITCPVKLILGADDRMTPVEKGADLGQLISVSSVNVIADCGHMVMVERPNETLKVIKQFLYLNPDERSKMT